MADRKRMGCCTVCDEPIFEVAARWVEGLRAGEPRQIGRVLPGARRLTMVRASGRQSHWSLCADCRIAPKDLPRLNRKEIAAMVMERDVSSHPASQYEKMLRLFEFDIPLGVLCEKPWSEVR